MVERSMAGSSPVGNRAVGAALDAIFRDNATGLHIVDYNRRRIPEQQPMRV